MAAPAPAVASAAARGVAPRDTDSPSRCPNCGAAADDSFCPRCGQEQHDSHRSLRSIFADALDAFAGWDAKIPSTLALLFVRPGQLTRDYLGGRRARYLRPLRLYLMLSVACFFALRYEADRQQFQMARVVDDGPGVTTSRAPRAVPNAGTPSVGEVVAAARAGNEAGIDSAAFGDFLARKPGEGQGGPSARFKARFKDRFRELARMPQAETQRVLRDSFFAKVGTMMFCLLPIFALLLRVLYRRARLFYAEHFVFALHAHAFAFGALALITLLGEARRAASGIAVAWIATPLAALAGVTSVALASWIPVYVFLALRRVYGGSRKRTLVKYLLLGGMYFVAAMAGILITVLTAVIVG